MLILAWIIDQDLANTFHQRSQVISSLWNSAADSLWQAAGVHHVEWAQESNGFFRLRNKRCFASLISQSIEFLEVDCKTTIANLMQCKTIVVSVTARSRLGTALCTVLVWKKNANCKIRLRNSAHWICLIGLNFLQTSYNFFVDRPETRHIWSLMKLIASAEIHQPSSWQTSCVKL